MYCVGVGDMITAGPYSSISSRPVVVTFYLSGRLVTHRWLMCPLLTVRLCADTAAVDGSVVR